jgi:hypothetical protein
MTPAGMYYNRAIEFLNFAEQVPEIEKREALRKLANCWLQMAERAVEYDRKRSSEYRAAA